MSNRTSNIKKIGTLALALCMAIGTIVVGSQPARAAAADVYIPLNISSGFTHDVVVEPGSTIVNNQITTATYFDGGDAGGNTAFYSKGLTINGGSGAYGLPADGKLTFTDGGQQYDYQLASYTSNNVVQVSRPSDSDSPERGSFEFLTPGAYSKLSILGAAGNGSVRFTATVIYTDNTTATTAFRAPNWATNTYCITGRIKIAKVSGDPVNVGDFDDYAASLYHFEVPTDTTKLVKQIDFEYLSDDATIGVARANLMAVSGCIPAGAPDAPIAAAATDITDNGFTANWAAAGGADGYALDVSTSPDFDTLLSGYNNLSVSGTSYSVTGCESGTTYYYRVRAKNSDGQSASSNAISLTTTGTPKTLSSIAVTTPPAKTTYTEGEAFDSTGMVVTATYTDNSDGPVARYTVSPTGALSLGTTAVTVSYTVGGVTKTTTQDITVLPDDGGLGVVDVILTADDGEVILAPMATETDITYYYKTTLTDDGANKPQLDDTDLTGWTAYDSDNDLSISAANGTRIYVQVIKVKDGKIKAWGQDAETPGIYYVVTFDSRGGSTVDSASVAVGDKIPKPNDPTKSGNRFGGWYLEPSCRTEWNFSQDTVYADLTLYAKWTQNSSGGGGGGAPLSNKPAEQPKEDAELDVTAEKEDDKLRAVIDSKEAKALIEDAKQHGTVVLNPEGAAGTKIVEVVLAKDTVSELAKDTAAEIQLNAGDGMRVTIANSELSKITGDLHIIATKDGKNQFSVNIQSGESTAAVTATVCFENMDGNVAYTLDANGAKQVIKLSVVEGDRVYAAITSPATVIIERHENLFADMTGHPMRTDADFVANRALFVGVSEGVFDPNGSMTMGMMSAVLHRLDGEPPVTASESQWYARGVQWARNNSLITGTDPMQTITRLDLATSLYRYAKMIGLDTTDGKDSVLSFSDMDSLSGEAKDAIQWAAATGILQGYGNNTIGAHNDCTRIQVAAMFERFIQSVVK